MPYSGFPTDAQAQMMVLMALTPGLSIITERIFESRFMHVSELARLGADIEIEGPSAIVKGGKPLSGAPVMASDLRASAALVIAGLAAKGSTQVNRVYHLDRGYENMDAKLRKLGARLELSKRYTDHHRYTETELNSFITRCVRRDLEMIVTTEKDAVRLPRLAKTDVPIYFLRVEIQILSGHESWEHCVARICKPQPLLSPERFFA